MRGAELLDKLELVDPAFVEAAENYHNQGKKRRIWPKFAAVAACLCLVIGFAAYRANNPSSPASEDGDGPSQLVVNGCRFVISPYLANSDELPEGFAYAGEADVGGYEDRPYYVSQDRPEWVYVYQEIATDGAVDDSGTLNPTEPHMAYVRYVDYRIRGKALACYDGSYYIALWNANCYGDTPDVDEEYFDAMESAYGYRVEGDAPEGFYSVGTAEFSGYDTVPRGGLASNQGQLEVFADPDAPEVLLVRAHWYTATAEENGETRHDGFNVYIRYDCPLA
jgi:hypothetical protein